MDGHPGSAGPPAEETELERVNGTRKPARLRRRRWPWFIVGVALVATKAAGYPALLHHRTALIVLLALGLAFSPLRPRPAWIALEAAALVALVIDARPLALGFAVGIGTFVLLVVLSLAVGTALHAWHDHRRAGRLRR